MLSSEKIVTQRKRRIEALAHRAFEEDFASIWLEKPSRLFGQRSPIDCAADEIQANAVVSFIDQLIAGTSEKAKGL